ncbi:30S ribosomal protein S8 [Patescibacteria group bacterium]|nr:MAG: 30S ribosomal protein S8 [Patescibacteria group bacterium]
MMTDPIADMLTRIRNASMAKKKEVVVPFSRLKMNIAELLVKHGYLQKAEEKKEKHPFIVLVLKYNNSQPAISSIKRVSRPGQRQYIKKDEIKPVLEGFGLAILSTPKGLLTDKEARQGKVGGEVICEVY